MTPKCWIQLGRYGDILNILPLIQARYKDYAIVHTSEFNDLFALFPNSMQIPVHTHDLKVFLNKRFRISQVDQNPAAEKRESRNFTLESWRLVGHEEEYHSYPLILPIKWKPERGKVFLNLTGVSSAIDRGMAGELTKMLFGLIGKHNVVNITGRRLPSFLEVAKLMAICEKMVTIDTATLHLGYGFRIPTIALSRFDTWYQSQFRNHWLGQITYPQLRDSMDQIKQWIRDGGPMRPVGKIRLFVNTYNSGNSVRDSELVTCLELNKLLFDEVVELRERPTFDDFFAEINKRVNENDISVIANSDIYFMNLSELKTIKKGECYALTRWEENQIGESKASQDSWVFRGRIPIKDCDFPLGYLGCDNALAFRLAEAGLVVTNPCYRIKSFHLHSSNHRVRSSNEAFRVKQQYKFVPHVGGRFAFTICLNAKHHLEKLEPLIPYFTKWVFIEGPAQNGGSTSWCNKNPVTAGSMDGTCELLKKFAAKYTNVRVCFGTWDSKDTMVNKAIEILGQPGAESYLWQIDADEIWTPESLRNAELDLTRDAGVGMFKADYYIGEHLVVRGQAWGEGPYKRLWRWTGEPFVKHEPPILEGEGKEKQLSQRFQHNAYLFEQDVAFKEKYYGRHQGIMERWKRLNSLPETSFPIPVSEFLPWAKGTIHYVSEGASEICSRTLDRIRSNFANQISSIPRAREVGSSK